MDGMTGGSMQIAKPVMLTEVLKEQRTTIVELSRRLAVVEKGMKK